MDQRSERLSLTTIYFLLTAGEVSLWHQVTSDEIGHYYEGDPLDLFIADPSFQHIEQRILEPVSEGAQPVQVVSARKW